MKLKDWLLSLDPLRYFILLVFAFNCIFISAEASSYYFSTASGNDSRSAAQAQNPLTPWKTINKLNNILDSLQPGDSILFKRGEIFVGSISVRKSGTLNAPIVFSAFGKGNNPVITSLVSLSQWEPVGDGIWESYHPELGKAVNILLLNGVLQEIGRYPNSDGNNKGYLTIDSFDSNLSITDHKLLAAPDWTGAEVVIRKNRWAIDRNIIKSHVGTTLTYISSSGYKAKNNFGYFIQNHIKTLDRVGEWFYDPSKKKMYVYFGANAPSSYKIEVSTFNNLVFSYNCSHIVFSNLTFKGGNTDSFEIKKGSGITISECEILFSGQNGLSVADHYNFKIENSSILNSNSTGIDLSASNNYAIIRNNLVENTGLFPGMGKAAGSNGIGIQCYSKDGLIEYNKVLNSGYNGIAIKLNRTITKNNFISTFCSVKDDGGGIYSHNGSNKVLAGAIISGNIIENGVGAPEGTDSFVSKAEGIYMDDNANTVEISNNTVVNCHSGMYLHNARNIVAVGNIFFNNDVQFYARHDKQGDPVRDLTVNNNIFFSKLPTQTVSQFETRGDDIGNMGSINNNYYARPFDEGIIFYNSFKKSSGLKIKKLLDLEGWQSLYGKDSNSEKAPFQIAPYIIEDYIGLNKYANGTFTTKEIKVFGNQCTPSWEDAGLLDNGYLKVNPSADGSSVTMSVGPLDSNKVYILKYSVIGEGEMSIGAFLRYGGAPYKPISAIAYRKLSIGRSDHEIMLTPSVSQQSGTLVFTVDQSHQYFMDNIQLYEAKVRVRNPDDYILFEYNATKESRTVFLNGNYVDIKNNKIFNSVELAPFSSIILLKQTGDVGYTQN